jgi:hypothetical protein
VFFALVFFLDRLSLYVQASLDSNPPICAPHIAGMAGAHHHIKALVEMGLMNFLPRLTWNCYPHSHCLQSSFDYRSELPYLALLSILLLNTQGGSHDNSVFNFLTTFLLGYIHYTGGGFIMTILIRLTLYIRYIAPIVSPPQPPPHPT